MDTGKWSAKGGKNRIVGRLWVVIRTPTLFFNTRCSFRGSPGGRPLSSLLRRANFRAVAVRVSQWERWQFCCRVLHMSYCVLLESTSGDFRKKRRREMKETCGWLLGSVVDSFNEISAKIKLSNKFAIMLKHTIIKLPFLLIL
jgi:hypothetical protein